MKKLGLLLSLVALLSCAGGDPSPSGSSSSKCGCSKYNKAQCSGTCHWTVGKGCGC